MNICMHVKSRSAISDISDEYYYYILLYMLVQFIYISVEHSVFYVISIII